MCVCLKHRQSEREHRDSGFRRAVSAEDSDGLVDVIDGPKREALLPLMFCIQVNDPAIALIVHLDFHSSRKRPIRTDDADRVDTRQFSQQMQAKTIIFGELV